MVELQEDMRLNWKSESAVLRVSASCCRRAPRAFKQSSDRIFFERETTLMAKAQVDQRRWGE